MANHLISRRVYYTIFMSLIGLTALTVYVAFFDLGPLNTIAAMTIACTKALLVVLYFMHLRYASRLTWILLGSGLLWLAILLVLTMVDYVSRGWLPFPGK